MILATASGKGGTGKTTVACNLAVALESPVVFADCDVEEPNAHLFLKPHWDGTESVTVDVPEMDTARCTLCGACQEICQFKAIAVLPETLLVFQELCHSCGGCALVCPEKAVSWKAREVGLLRVGHRGPIRFVDGTLKIGEAMPPPLIRRVRRKAAETLGASITILDAPPGTSCPVVTSLWESDYVLLVTEPTPFGLNDLELAVGAVKKMGLPCGIVINRCDIGDARAREFAWRENIPILLEIPFDRQVAEHLAKGDVLVEVLPRWKEMMQELHRNVLQAVEALQGKVSGKACADSEIRSGVSS